MKFFTECPIDPDVRSGSVEIPLTKVDQVTPVPPSSSAVAVKHASPLSREEHLAKANELKRRYRESGEGGCPNVVNVDIPLPQTGPRPKGCKVEIKMNFIYYFMLNNCAANCLVKGQIGSE